MSGHTVSSVDYVRGPIACMFVSVTSRFDLCRVCMESFCWSECFGMVQKFPVSACLLMCEYKHVNTCVTWPSTSEPPSLAASPQEWWQKNRLYPGHFVFSECFLLHRPLGFDILISQKKIILTEISHSAKVTKHTIRINNPRTWEDSSVGERTWVQSLEYRHDIMHL